jgi:hypothetical protein
MGKGICTTANVIFHFVFVSSPGTTVLTFAEERHLEAYHYAYCIQYSPQISKFMVCIFIEIVV